MSNVTKMRFGVLVEKGKIEVRERPLPELGEFDVLVKQDACNICTTDYTQYLGFREHQGYPMAGGHEGSGHIIKLGKGVREFQVGDHVGIACASCGYCEHCKTGHEGLCEDNDLSKHITPDGYKGPFGFADYVVIPARRCIKVAQELPAAEAGFLEPLATVVKGIKRLGVKPQDTVVVIGAGTMGLLNGITLKAKACRVIITEMMENKIANAKAEGLEVVDVSKCDPVEEVMRLTGGKGADAVVIAVGSTSANNQAVQMLKDNYGKILVFAASFPEPRFEISSNVIHYKRMEIYGTTGADYSDFMDAAKLLSMGAVKVTNLLEKKHFTLDQMQEAFDEATIPGKYRVTISL